MQKRLLLVAKLCLLLWCSGTQPVLACGEQLDKSQLQKISQQVFLNECNAKVDCLVDWNVGEDFPSLGIGHFIWYPRGVDRGFVESFPLLIDFLKQQGAPLPQWLIDLQPFDAPWRDREEFLQRKNSEKVNSLRLFLLQNQDQQTAFMLQRMQRSLAQIVESTPHKHRKKVQYNLDSLCQSHRGIYPLIDYVNFKGEGLSPTETYKGQGWGLKQVLMEMESDSDPAYQFQLAATKVLTRRVNNANKSIEQKWLKGWKVRLRTYTDF